MDVELVKRAQRGDERAFEALVVATHARLFRVAHGILREPVLAEDATQRAFLEVWRSLPRLRDRAGFGAWTLGRLIATCRTQATEQAARAAEDDPVPLDPTAGDPFGIALDRDQLSRCFGQLSFDDRVVLVLRFLADLPADEAGRALDLGAAAFEARTEAALRALEAELDGEASAGRGLRPQPEGA